jgi:hypothetical protein
MIRATLESVAAAMFSPFTPSALPSPTSAA